MISDAEIKQAVQEVQQNAEEEIQDYLDSIDEFKQKIDPSLGVDNQDMIELSINLENLKIERTKKILIVQLE